MTDLLARDDKERVSVLIDRGDWVRIRTIAKNEKRSNGRILREAVSRGLPVLEGELRAERARQRAIEFLSSFKHGEFDFEKIDLTEAPLQNRELDGIWLAGSSLTGADLSGASLRGAVLRSADLRDANLRRASLRNADLTGANLKGADLSLCDLFKAKFDSQTVWPDEFDHHRAGAMDPAELSDHEDKVRELDQRLGLTDPIPGELDVAEGDAPIPLPPPSGPEPLAEDEE